MRPNTIILHGMMTSHNFGDVLLAQITSSWIREISGFDVKAVNGAPDVLAELGIKKASLKDFQSANAVVLSGGGYFQVADRGYTAIKRMAKYVTPLLMARLLGKPTAVFGVGVAPLPNAVMRWALREILNHSHFTTVRDPVSLASAHALNPERRAIETTDLVFALSPKDLARADKEAAHVLRGGLQQRRVFAIHLAAPSDASSAYKELYTVIQSKTASMENVGFLLLEDHPSPRSPQRLAQEELFEFFGNRRSRVIPYTSTYRLAAILHEVDAVLTNKLHVGLVAAAMGTPTFSIAKHTKNRASFDAMGLSEHCCELDSANGREMAGIVERFLNSSPHFRLPSDLRVQAKKNKEYLRRFLKLTEATDK